MANFKEIVTKAVIGKSKKTTTSTFKVETEEHVDTVLGCWVINHTFKGRSNGTEVLIDGGFDVNIWYSYGNDTKTGVSTKRFTYTDKMPVHLKDGSSMNETTEIIVRSLKQPTVTNVEVKEGFIDLSIEKELGVEVVGDAKIKVSIEEDEDDYEEIVDVNDDELDTVTEDYLKQYQQKRC